MARPQYNPPPRAWHLEVAMVLRAGHVAGHEGLRVREGARRRRHAALRHAGRDRRRALPARQPDHRPGAHGRLAGRRLRDRSARRLGSHAVAIGRAVRGVVRLRRVHALQQRIRRLGDHRPAGIGLLAARGATRLRLRHGRPGGSRRGNSAARRQLARVAAVVRRPLRDLAPGGAGRALAPVFCAACWLQPATSLSVGSAAPTTAAAGSNAATIAMRATRLGPRVIISNLLARGKPGVDETSTCKVAASRARWHVVRSPESPRTEPEGGSIMAKAKGRSERNVRDVMVMDVVTVEPSASLTDAARVMEDANVGMLPVVQDGKVVGVITDRDIVIRAVAREADPASTAVGDCLSINAIVAHPDWSTERAMQTMAQAQVGRLPVLDDNEQLVGVVTLSSMAFRAPEKDEALEAAQEVSRRSAKRSA